MIFDQIWSIDVVWCRLLSFLHLSSLGVIFAQHWQPGAGRQNAVDDPGTGNPGRTLFQYCLHLLTRKNMKKHSAKMCKAFSACSVILCEHVTSTGWECACDACTLAEGKKKTWRWFQTEVHQIHNLLIKGTSVHLRLKNNSIPQNLPVVWEAGHCSLLSLDSRL